MRLMVMVAALAFSTSAVAQERQQFDLVCTGNGAATRYRVDLARGEACSDACERVWKLGEVTSGQIKLIDRAPAYRGDLEERDIVNRSTGQWTRFAEVNGRRYSRSGTCEVASFSGFPSTKF